MRDNQRRVRNHFLPVFLLKNFAGEDGRLFAYDREKDWNPRPDLPKNLAYENNLYAPGTSDDSGRHPKDDAVERWLADQIDSPASTPITRLVGGASLSDLSDDENHAIADFLALLDMRIPAIRDRLVPAFAKGAADAIMDHKRTRKALLKQGLRTSLSEVRRIAARQRGELVASLAKPAWLKWMSDTRHLARLNVKARRWALVHAPPTVEFCTSDRCSVKALVTMSEPAPWEPGTLLGRAHWLVPLSPALALAVMPKDCPYDPEGSAGLVRAVNRQFFRDAVRYVYSRQPVNILDLDAV